MKNEASYLTPVSRKTATFTVGTYITVIRAVSAAGAGTISVVRAGTAVVVPLSTNIAEYFRVQPGESVTLAGDTIVNEMA